MNKKFNAYLLGGGIGSLAAAAFMIRDGGLSGKNIFILEPKPILGGSLDGYLVLIGKNAIAKMEIWLLLALERLSLSIIFSARQEERLLRVRITPCNEMKTLISRSLK